MRESFIFYKSFYNAISKIKNKELKADIYDAICELGLNEHVQELNSEVGQIIMELIKPQIIANKDKYEKGQQGGRPKEYDEEKIEDLILQGYSNKDIEREIGCSISTIKNVRTKTRQKLGQKLPKSQKPNVNDNDNVNVNDNDIKKENIKEKKGNITIFGETPPIDGDGKRKDISSIKHKYGEYKHVLLTNKEFETLIETYGEEETKQLITYLDEYIEMKGYKAKSHYLCIKKWVVKAVKEHSKDNQLNEMKTPNWFNKKVEKKEENIGELEEILKDFE